ncbi:MAG: hypothetical protein M3119_02445, partial [Verrucomicrobiota bacterium]|nr:hypothetical protein [Verrucomicrobiota bacterium]
MKTKKARLCDPVCRHRLPLLAAVLGFLTLLPFLPAAAQVGSARVLDGQEFRNSNGDLLATTEGTPVPVSDMSFSGNLRDRLTDYERRGGRPISPNATTGVSTWTGGTGNWSDGTMWAPVNPPNDAAADVFVDGGKTGVSSVVTMDGSFTVGRLTIDAGDSVAVSNNNDLRVSTAGAFAGSGNIINNGNLSLNANGNQSRLVLLGGGGVTLSGTGILTLAGTTGANHITGDSFGSLFTNQSTIQGTGNFGLNIIDITNQGLIDANLTFAGTNSIYLDALTTFTNSGTLRASNGGLLQLGASNYANAGGTILATG